MSRAAGLGRRLSTRIAAVGFAALLTAVGVPAAVASPAAGHAQAPFTDQSVTMSVVSMNPSTPLSDNKKHDLTLSVRLVNTTDQSLDSVTVQMLRGVPIMTQQELDSAIAHPQPPDPNLSVQVTPKDGKPVTTALAPHGSAVIAFTTDTDIAQDAALCICANAIYPLYVTAHTTDVTGSDVTIGVTQTYLPVFDKPSQVAPMQVSWIWPILDRPHRLTDETTAGQPPLFVDDELSESITSGRLSRVLDVLVRVAGQVPMTVVIDPELIDELAVMAAGTYRVGTGTHTVAGTGSDAARSWLTTLRTTLAQPGIEVSYTPFADPDVETLTRNGLSWTSTLGAAAQSRVADALGTPVAVDHLTWPVGEEVSTATLNALVREGTTSILLNDTALPSAQQSPVPNGLASVQTTAGPVTALVTVATVQKYVPAVVDAGNANGLATLPELVSEVAIRALQNGESGAYVPIVPPREVDPDDAQVAAQAIIDTAHTFWSTGIGVGDAAAHIQPSNRGQLVPPTNGSNLPSAAMAAAETLTQVIPALDTMLDPADASRLLGALPAAVQRAESSGWRSDPAGGEAFAALLSHQLDALETGVQIIRPSTGTYTLASSNSPLPITVVNNLDVNVTVNIDVEPVNGLPGFSATEIQHQRIPPKTRVTLHVPTSVERTGRFRVVATLLTPSGERIGTAVPLSVRSTALGLIGIVITVVAAVVLALALIVRLIRRLRQRRDPQAPDQPTPAPGETVLA